MAARKQKHEEEEHVEGQERWLLTYADMITLLMVLFIVLFSIGQLDLKKFEQLRAGLNASFGTPTPQLASDAAGASGVLDGGITATGKDLTVEQVAQALTSQANEQASVRREQQALAQTEQQIQGTLEGA